MRKIKSDTFILYVFYRYIPSGADESKRINKSDTFFYLFFPLVIPAQAGIQSFIDYGTVLKSAVIIA